MSSVMKRPLSRGRLRVGIAVAVLGLGMSLSSGFGARAATSSYNAPVAGCDGSQRGVSYGPGGTNAHPANVEPCITYNFADYGENGIIISTPQKLANGVITPARLMIGGIYKPNQLLPDFGNMATSVDGGATWDRVLFAADSTQLAGNSEGSDPGFYQDPNTNRLFFYRDASNEGPFSTVDGEYHISYTDDGGETWVNNYTLQLFPGVSDAVVMFAGPPRTSADATALKAARYPDVTYLCGHLPESACFKSLDGGIGFTQLVDSSGTDEASANGAVTAGPDGTLYGLASGTVTMSTDDGGTWKPVPAALPTGFGSDCARPSGYGSLFLDKNGNIYVGGTNSHAELAVTYSTNRGVTWSNPAQLQMPGTGITMCTFAADWNRPGHFVASYYAYPPGATVGSVESYGTTSGPVHGYMTVTDNLFNSSPVFTSVQVDSNADPLMPEGGPCTFPFEACVPHSASRIDYISVNFNPVDGRPWAVYAQDMCSSIPACAEEATAGGAGNYWTNNTGAVATIAIP